MAVLTFFFCVLILVLYRNRKRNCNGNKYKILKYTQTHTFSLVNASSLIKVASNYKKLFAFASIPVFILKMHHLSIINSTEITCSRLFFGVVEIETNVHKNRLVKNSMSSQYTSRGPWQQTKQKRQNTRKRILCVFFFTTKQRNTFLFSFRFPKKKVNPNFAIFFHLRFMFLSTTMMIWLVSFVPFVRAVRLPPL